MSIVKVKTSLNLLSLYSASSPSPWAMDGMLEHIQYQTEVFLLWPIQIAHSFASAALLTLLHVSI